MTKLNLEIIDSYGMKKESWTPDYDDRGFLYTLPCGIVVSTLFMCNNSPCDSDALEGLDGWIYIETKEDLDKIFKMDIDQVFEMISKNNNKFNPLDYRDEYE